MTTSSKRKALQQQSQPLKRKRRDSIQSIGSVDYFRSTADLMREGLGAASTSDFGNGTSSLLSGGQWDGFAEMFENNSGNLNLTQLDDELNKFPNTLSNLGYGTIGSEIPRTPRTQLSDPFSVISATPNESEFLGGIVGEGSSVTVDGVGPISTGALRNINRARRKTPVKKRKTKVQNSSNENRESSSSRGTNGGVSTEDGTKAQRVRRRKAGNKSKPTTSRAWRPAGQARHIPSELDEESKYEVIEGPNGPVRRERKNNREKRRRQAMNDRFDELTDVLLEDLQDEKLQRKTKWNKSDVLGEAIRAIRGLRSEMEELRKESAALNL
eukprot:g1337.t1